jgi:ABC-type multidrug transport system permease subunit
MQAKNFILMTSITIGQIELIIVQLTLDTALAVTSVVAVISVFIFSCGAIFPWPGLEVKKKHFS